MASVESQQIDSSVQQQQNQLPIGSGVQSATDLQSSIQFQSTQLLPQNVDHLNETQSCDVKIFVSNSEQQQQLSNNIADTNHISHDCIDNFTPSTHLMPQNGGEESRLIGRIEPNTPQQQFVSNHALQHHLNGENQTNIDLGNIESNNSQFHNAQQLPQHHSIINTVNDERQLISNEQFASSAQQLTPNTSEAGNIVSDMTGYSNAVQQPVNTAHQFDGWYNVGIIKGTKYFVSQFIYPYAHQQNIINEV